MEANGQRILFDTGKSKAFANNAEEMNVDLGKVDMAVLSHGHSDHGGGLAAFFAANKTAPLYLRTTAEDDHYVKLLFLRRYVGIDKEVLKANERRLRWVKEDMEIAPGVHVLTSIPDSEPRPDTQRSILVKTAQGFAPDLFKHELVLVVKEDNGISVITGCGHLGVLNMIQAAKRRFPEAPIKAVIGGFHLIASPISGGMSATAEDTKAMALRFEDLGCQSVVSGHCTGRKASALLQDALKGRFRMLATGTILEI